MPQYIKKSASLLVSVIALCLFWASDQAAVARVPASAQSVSQSGVASVPAISPEYCGGRVAPHAVQRYRKLIDSALATSSGSRLALARLFAAHVTLVTHNGVVTVSRKDLQSFKGKLPTRSDWRVIASAISHGELTSAGWRGCMISHGKAGFATYGNGKIGLSAFDFTRPWKLGAQ